MSLVQNALKKDFSIGDYKEHLQLALKDLEWEGLELSKRQGGPATHDSVTHLYHLFYILINPALSGFNQCSHLILLLYISSCFDSLCKKYLKMNVVIQNHGLSQYWRAHISICPLLTKEYKEKLVCHI